MVAGMAMLTSVFAEYRDFTGISGNIIKAELLSHRGGKVTIKREDGQQFDVDPAIFASNDEAYIRQWMSVNPEKVGDGGATASKIDLRIDANKKMLDRDKYCDSTSSRWAYEVTVQNRGQQPVKDIRVLYRAFFENYGAEERVEGEETLRQDLEFNRTWVVTSTAISISKNNYSRSGRSAGVKGCLVRVVDSEGKVLADWVSGDIGMKGKTWDNTTRVERCDAEPPPPVIR